MPLNNEEKSTRLQISHKELSSKKRTRRWEAAGGSSPQSIHGSISDDGTTYDCKLNEKLPNESSHHCGPGQIVRRAAANQDHVVARSVGTLGGPEETLILGQK
jgi:hypothetical protein